MTVEIQKTARVEMRLQKGERGEGTSRCMQNTPRGPSFSRRTGSQPGCCRRNARGLEVPGKRPVIPESREASLVPEGSSRSVAPKANPRHAMALRNRGGKFHYRFALDGKEYGRTTGLAATKSNVTAAQFIEAEHRRALLEGRQPFRRILIRQFDDAAREFLNWAQVEYRAHPSSHRRIAVSFTSARLFFGREPVSMIDESRIEDYKSHRIRKHNLRDVTLRHDLHALSKFFGYAIKQGWARENPIRKVAIPPDTDAVRIQLSTQQKKRHTSHGLPPTGPARSRTTDAESGRAARRDSPSREDKSKPGARAGIHHKRQVEGITPCSGPDH